MRLRSCTFLPHFVSRPPRAPAHTTHAIEWQLSAAAAQGPSRVADTHHSGLWGPPTTVHHRPGALWETWSSLFFRELEHRWRGSRPQAARFILQPGLPGGGHGYRRASYIGIFSELSSIFRYRMHPGGTRTRGGDEGCHARSLTLYLPYSYPLPAWSSAPGGPPEACDTPALAG
jgi:hypothetical protein